jgi:NAD(P)-dependent dehydrogenase (short-subunit alcohol dehydrogenase family)
MMPNQISKTIVITGASDGIGAAAARKLKADGHLIVVVGRDANKTKTVANEINSPYEIADFSDLGQVTGLAAALDSKYEKIEVLANNAGVMFGNFAKTVDGFERTFQVNHLAPFLLTHLLHSKLLASKATVVNTSSMTAKMWGKLDLNDLNNEINYDEKRAYGTAKLCNILFTKEFDRRFRKSGINTVAFHPGVVSTNFASDPESSFHKIYHSDGKPTMSMITPDAGADQLIWISEGEAGKDWQPGEYYDLRKLGELSEQAKDLDLALKLWDESARLLKL